MTLVSDMASLVLIGQKTLSITVNEAQEPSATVSAVVTPPPHTRSAELQCLHVIFQSQIHLLAFKGIMKTFSIIISAEPLKGNL